MMNYEGELMMTEFSFGWTIPLSSLQFTHCALFVWDMTFYFCLLRVHFLVSAVNGKQMICVVEDASCVINISAVWIHFESCHLN